MPAQARLFGNRHWRGKRCPMRQGRSAAALCALANSRIGLKRACFGIDLTGDGTMLNHELRHDDGILVIRPEGPLEAGDFTALASQVDAYLESRLSLRGVLIRAREFPGWRDFDGMLAHLRFVRDHHHKIERVAVVADGAAASILPAIAGHFIHAQVQHFDFAREEAAWQWLRQTQIDTRINGEVAPAAA